MRPRTVVLLAGIAAIAAFFLAPTGGLPSHVPMSEAESTARYERVLAMLNAGHPR